MAAGAILLFSTPALAAASSADILAANRAAKGGDAWNGKAELQIDYAYTGQGLTGQSHTRFSLQRSAFVDSAELGPSRTANGFDGVHAWEREPSGTVTDQGAGDVLPLAVNEAYRDRNLWWTADRGGATIVVRGRRHDAQGDYDVLTVTPRGGEPFEAWFDVRTHLLARTVETQVTLTITTTYADYAAVDGVQIAQRLVVDDGTGAAGLQTMTLTRARFLPAKPNSATYAAPAEDLHDFSLAGGVRDTTVPFRLINNHIYAAVSVNGAAPMQFLFDTGGHDILTPPTAKTLGVKAEGAMTATGAGSGFAQSGVATVRSIRIGAATLVNQPVGVLQFSNAAEGVDEQGMIGYEVFARFVTRIDYGRRRLTLIDRRYFDPKDAGTPIPFRFYHHLPVMQGSYDGVPGAFCADTGARTPLSLNGQFVDAHGLRARTGKGVEALTGWGVGGASRAVVTHGGVLKLGEVTVEAPLTELSLDTGGSDAAAAFPNNVGGGVLKRFIVTLDYAHSRLYLKPIAGPIADLDTFDRSGMWINAGAGGFEVTDVTKGGPAEEAGLKKGDLITAVDGKAVDGPHLHDLRERLRDDPPGTAVTFTLETPSGPRQIALTLRDQF
jgi:hypothetical protein